MTQPATILVVEDELNIRTALVTMLEKRGYVAASAGTVEEALRLLDETTVDLVITDLKMPGIGGMELLRKVKEAWPATEVVVMTAYGSIETAVEAMRSGAYDYITKPIDRDRFPVLVEKALERHFLTSENRQLRDRLETKARFEDMIGDSALMHQIYNLVEMVAASDVTVLVVGESGTGKELLARAIHQKSPRAGGPFISVNCGALPDTLLESELFGYEKGAFTGAMGPRSAGSSWPTEERFFSTKSENCRSNLKWIFSVCSRRRNSGAWAAQKSSKSMPGSSQPPIGISKKP